jgi:hypothetical protein
LITPVLSSVDARSVAQIKAEVIASQSALPDAPVGASVADLAKYTPKKVSRVLPTGIGAQLPGDRENNMEAIAATKFDLRWAVRRQRHRQAEGDRRACNDSRSSTPMPRAHTPQPIGAHSTSGRERIYFVAHRVLLMCAPRVSASRNRSRRSI